MSWPSSPSSFSRSVAAPIQSLHARYRDWRRATSVYKAMREGADAREWDESTGSVFSMDEPQGDLGPEALPLARIVPDELRAGESMLKVTQKKVAQRVIVLNTASARIEWDSKMHNNVPLSSIREVRVGSDAATYRMSLSIPPAHEPRWISVVYQTASAYKALHLVALSDASMARWSTALLRVQAQRQALLSGRLPAARAQSQWLSQSWPAHGALGLDGVAQLCARSGVQVSMPELSALYRATGGSGLLDYDAFQRLAAALHRRADIEAVYTALGGTDALDRGTFAAFVRTVQGETWSDAHIERVYTMHADPATGRMSAEGLALYLASRDNSAVQPAEPARTNTAARIQASTPEALLATPPGPRAAPMAHPLTDYFICSSHNTYLVGGQWKGDSTVEGYVRALQQGVRSVELDCWNGSNGPQVTHGHTLTSAVPFADVVAAVAQYAFAASPYPLILSLEVHCDVAQQEIMAAVLREKLGDALVTTQLEPVTHVLPSPDALRGRILVKAKDWNLIRDTMPAPVAAPRETDSESDGSLLGQARRIVGNMQRGSDETPAMSPSLTSLLVYTVGVQCRGINKKEHYAPEHIFSLSDRKASRMLRTAAYDLAKHNLTHLTRVYPSMASIDRLHRSANPVPINYWAAGCQLVALNWQTHDIGFEINQALFAGSQGYVLKPRALRVRDALKESGSYVRVVIRLAVVSAQQLPPVRPSEAVSPCVHVGVHVPAQWRRTPVLEIDSSGAGLVPVLAHQLKGTCAAVHGPRYMAQWGDDEDVPQPAGTQRARDTHGAADYMLRESSPLDTDDDSASCSLQSADSYSSASSMPPLQLPAAGMPGKAAAPAPAPPKGASPALQSAPTQQSRISTHVVPNNGLAPVWNTQCTLTIDIPAGRMPEPDGLHRITRGMLDLCFVRFQVNDERTGTVLGSSTACLGRLSPGLRHLPLHDAQLTPLLYSSLLVHTAYASAAIVD